MSFYGNISNAGKTNLTFDKIYPNRKTMIDEQSSDEVFIGRFVLVEYDDNTFPHRRGYLNPNDETSKGYKLYSAISRDAEGNLIYENPYFLSSNSEDGYGLKEGNIVFTEEDEIYKYYVCSKYSNEEDKTAIFTYITESNRELTDYTLNYYKDKEAFPEDFVDGWDSTIWQKAIINGRECYQMIATLNSKTPHFDIAAEAPSAESVAPHFGQNSTNMNYTLHMPTNYGFRIKETEDKEMSDESYIETIEDEEKTKYYDIYYNKKALDANNKLERFYSEEKDCIELAATGSSGKKYIKHQGSQIVAETANDIQELSIHLPSIGNIATEFWDLIYGDKNEDGTFKEVRNDDVSWDSSEGIRFIVKDQTTGSYNYLPKKVETIAGVINSTQDLMGRIVKYQTTLKDADLDHIYYRAIQEEGEKNFRPGFFMKVPSNELISFDELNEKYDLAFADYKEYIAGKNPQYLTQYEPNYYYIATGSGVKGKDNYLCEIGEKPTSDANFYTLHDPAPELIKLMAWEPTPEEELEEIKPEEVVAYYYREEDGNNINDGSIYYKYIKDTNKFPNKEKDYYSIKATKLSSLNFYNPEEYSEIVYDEEGHPVYEPIYDEDGNPIYDENGEQIQQLKYKHKSRIDENTNKTYYTGYFYYNDKAEQLIPVYPTNSFVEDEEYYLLRDYYFETSVNESGKQTNIYYLNNNKLDIESLKGNAIYVVNLISFNDQEIYQIDETGNIYQRVKNINDITQEGSYYTLDITLLTGYLEVKDEEEPAEDEEVETIYTNFYIPDTYYYKSTNGDYLLDRGSKLQKDKEYYFIDPQAINIVFYEPNKYYYYSKTKEQEGKDPDKLDDSPIMRTADDPDVVVQQIEGKEDFIYYLKRKSYVVQDTSNHLNAGMVWNVNSGEIPKGVVLGALFNDIIEELKAKGYDVEKKYEWKELKGFSQDLNTINGLILQLNKLYRFDDELTRDITTVQGMFNTLRDNFAKFDTLTPGHLLAVNEYGQLDSQDPSSLKLEGYEVASEAAIIEPEDTINQAFGKLEYKVNVLNGDSTIEGSVANQIAQIVEIDGGAVDKLKEIAAWIIDDQAGAAKIIADVATNAGDIIINKSNIEANEEAIKTLEELVGSKSVAEQITEAITAEQLDKYALADELNALADRVVLIENKVSDWDEGLNRTATLEELIDSDKASAWNNNLERTTALEELIDTEKVAAWDAAESNVQADWNVVDETADSFILNKPDLSNMVETTTEFNYVYDGALTTMTIPSLLEYIATLEARIYALENSTVKDTEQPIE